jgi:cytochrome c
MTRLHSARLKTTFIAGAGMAVSALLISPTAALAGDDPVLAGQHVFAARCAPCHEATATTRKPGPPLAGVFGRPSGSVPDFRYTPALKTAHLTWDTTTLDTWLQGPPALVHGTIMFASVSSATDRQNLIAYLKTLSPGAHAN